MKTFAVEARESDMGGEVYVENRGIPTHVDALTFALNHLKTVIVDNPEVVLIAESTSLVCDDSDLILAVTLAGVDDDGHAWEDILTVYAEDDPYN